MARYSVNGMQGRKLLEEIYSSNDLEDAIKKCQVIAERYEVDTLAIYDNEIDDIVKKFRVKLDR